MFGLGHQAILQLFAQWPGLWMAARLPVTLNRYRPHCFYHVNCVVVIQKVYINIRKAQRFVSKQGHRQPRFHSKARQLSYNCKMVYWCKLIFVRAFWVAICLRGYLHEPGTNSDWYELVLVWNFYYGLHETRTECLVPDFGTKWDLLFNKYIDHPKA